MILVRNIWDKRIYYIEWSNKISYFSEIYAGFYKESGLCQYLCLLLSKDFISILIKFPEYPSDNIKKKTWLLIVIHKSKRKILKTNFIIDKSDNRLYEAIETNVLCTEWIIKN